MIVIALTEVGEVGKNHASYSVYTSTRDRKKQHKAMHMHIQNRTVNYRKKYSNSLQSVEDRSF